MKKSTIIISLIITVLIIFSSVMSLLYTLQTHQNEKMRSQVNSYHQNLLESCEAPVDLCVYEQCYIFDSDTYVFLGERCVENCERARGICIAGYHLGRE